jgi:hypothetical protein
MEPAATSIGDCEICGASQSSGLVYTFTARVVDVSESSVQLMGRTTFSKSRELYHIADFPVFACNGCTTAPKRSRWAKWLDPDKTPVEIALRAVLGRIHASLALSAMASDNSAGTSQEIAAVAVRTQDGARDWTEDRIKEVSEFDGKWHHSGSTTQSVSAGLRRERHALPVLETLPRMPSASDLSLLRYKVHYFDRRPSLNLRPGQYAQVVERAMPTPPGEASLGPWNHEPCNQAVFRHGAGACAASLFHDGRGLLLLPDRRMVAFRHDWKELIR